MIVKSLVVTLIAAVLASAASCGSSSDDAVSGDDLTTGLPRDAKLDELDNEAAEQACKSLRDGTNARIPPNTIQRAQCTSSAIMASSTGKDETLEVDVEACEMREQECSAARLARAEQSPEADCAMNMADTVLEGCQATIRDYEACFNALVDELERRLQALSCTNAEQYARDPNNRELDVTKLPACLHMHQLCPNVPVFAPVGD